MTPTIYQTPRRRSSGILLHVTSLPGAFGIGDLGPAAHAWISTLARARQTWWQVLPLGPTGYADSPYQSFSAFAGNPFLISPELLLRDGLLDASELEGINFPADCVEFERVIPWKTHLLDRAWTKYQESKHFVLQVEFDRFCEEQVEWLGDFALFMAIKEAYGNVSWQQWPAEFLFRQPQALDRFRQEKVDRIGRHKFVQFLFFRQWNLLKDVAKDHDIRIIGDMPIFVATDSADVWTHPELFLLDSQR